MSEFLKTKAIILRRTNYGEADRILQILTPDNGKLSVMARGVRKEKSRLAGGIELFAVCDLTLTKSAQNTGEIWTLTGAKLNKFFAQIMTNYDKLQFGYEAIKQVARAAEQIDEPDFFELLADAFAALDDTKIDLKITQTWFYLSLAKLLGNELNMATDNHGMKLVEDARYNFDAGEQVFVFATSGRYDAGAIKLLRVMTSNRPDVVAKIAGVQEILDNCLYLAKMAAKV
ncbi:DNA repair protein RecO [Candidatus Saccharibacteria bacterium]|nr:DNA repair protein RecO [Candidatus Saccharibacteria bacterium]